MSERKKGSKSNKYDIDTKGGAYIGDIDTKGGAYIGGNVTTGGGDFVGGDKFSGDKIMGDKIGGDKITVGDISGTGIAIGRGASASVSTYNAVNNRVDLEQLFIPLQEIVAKQNPAFSGKVNELKLQIISGSVADDNQVASLMADIAEGVPSAKRVLVSLFQNPSVASGVGPTTQFMLGRLG